MTDYGFFPAITEARYHADNLLPGPTLNASTAKVLLGQSPAHAWHQHPRLNPDFAADHSTQFDIGKACHAMVAGGDDAIVIVDADSYRTKAAQEARQEAWDNGQIPVLTAQKANLDAMHDAFWRQVTEFYGFSFAFKGGVHEGTSVWSDERGANCRCRFDWLDPNGDPIIFDYKTTAGSAEPDAFGRQIFNMGYDIQEAFYRRGARQTLGWSNPDFIFVAQETSPPYALSMVQLDPAARDYADRKVDRSMRIWSECLSLDYWPAYRKQVATVPAPVWSQMQWDEREEQEKAGQGIMSAAYKSQRPLGE